VESKRLPDFKLWELFGSMLNPIGSKILIIEISLTVIKNYQSFLGVELERKSLNSIKLSID
jgi:hypothetical protein